MFTTEIDHDEIIITVLDENGYHEDVQFVLYDDIVYIRQWNEELDLFETILISPQMFDEFRKSLDLPEGAYTTRSKE